MNKSQRIHLDVESLGQDKNIKIKLEQDVDSLEFLTMSIDAKDVYRDFNADYGVLVGRVIANGGIGVPNARISVFVPLTDEDADDSSIASIYPYRTPRDKNAEGKRYNLLPRVAQYEQSTGLFKPKQPFGSFPIKPEIVVNQPFLNVYKKYYKYTALTNAFGDYMIFGVPIGTQSVHLSVDITDIGKYSMTPASMIKAGYPANLFTNGGEAIKSSNDLNDLPNIETQEISVDIIPFWGDTTNFVIGISRQDFRVKALLESNFVVFGTSMTMGDLTTIGTPDRGEGTNSSFYFISSDKKTNIDLRTYRPHDFTIRLFSYLPSIPIADIAAGDVDPINDIYELGKEEYFEFQQNGDFLISVPCNRTKIITNELGVEVPVDENNSFGVFTEFYGMMIVEYPDVTELTISKTYSNDFNGNNSATKIRGSKLKIPQRFGLTTAEGTDNDNWRKEFAVFKGGEFYSVAQFLATKNGDNSDPTEIDTDDNHENILPTGFPYSHTSGILFKVAGTNAIDQNLVPIFDENNYIIPPNLLTNTFTYDFPANVLVNDEAIDDGQPTDKFFGGQWINLSLIFPQIVWARGAGPQRDYHVADNFFNNYKDVGSLHFLQDNSQDIFAGLVNTRYFLKGDAYRTKFVNVPKTELAKLNNIPFKGFNINKFNNDLDNISLGYPQLNSSAYEYQTPTLLPTTGREYTKNAWDGNFPYSGVQIGTKPTAFLFKGMYDNDCVKLLFDLNIL